MTIQMQIALILLAPAFIGFAIGVMWPHIKTWWYYEISRKHKEWRKW